jgi:hypothetical protein
MKDNISYRTKDGQKVDTGLFFIAWIFRQVFLLFTFPLRVLWFFINPLPNKKGTPKQIKIRK